MKSLVVNRRPHNLYCRKAAAHKRQQLGRFCRSSCGSYGAQSEPILLQPRHRRSVPI